MPHSFLILSTNAFNYRSVHAELGESLRKQGHRVCYAIASRFADALHLEYPLRGPCYYFSAYSPSLQELEAADVLLGKEANLWEMFFPDIDRFLSIGYQDDKDMDWYASLARRLAAFFSDVIRREKIDFILYESISCCFSYFAYMIAQKLGATYLAFDLSRLPGRFEVKRQEEDYAARLNATYLALLQCQYQLDAQTQEAVESYVMNIEHIEPDYMKDQNFVSPSVIRKFFWRKDVYVKIWRTLGYELTRGNESVHDIGNVVWFILKLARRHIVRNLRVFACRRWLQKPILGERFYLYPLHYHPEASTSVCARHYINEAEVIRNIAFNMPMGTYLYVKEHRSAVGLPPLSFYRDLAKLPNVRLLDPDLNARSLIAQSKGVITLTSTVGYEAIILGKPVYTPVEPFYAFHPLVRHVPRWEQLHALLLEESDMDLPKHDALAFVGSYWLNTYDGCLEYSFLSPSQDMIENLARAIATEIAIKHAA
jgi:hypothetical protein